MSTNDLDLEQDPVLAANLPLDDRAGPAARISRDRAAAMIGQALASMPAGAAAAPIARGRGLLATLALAAAALLMLTGGVALARYAYEHLIAAHVQQPAKQSTAVPADRKPPSAAPVKTAVPAAEAVAAAETDSVAETDSEPDSDSETEPDSETVAETGSGRAGVGRKSHELLAPDDLLQKANRLRSIGEFADAAATYSQVYEHDARSLSAYVAEVAAASIELEHLAHPARARKLFERALRTHPEGALDLEARQGLALSLRDLGDANAESAALRSLIERHPQSPAAKRATLRLHELARGEN